MRYRIARYIRELIIILWGVMVAGLFGAALYAGYHRNIYIGNLTFRNEYVDKLETMPFWIYLVLCSTLALWVCIVLFLGLSLYYNRQRTHFNRQRNRYHRFFSRMLAFYFFEHLSLTQRNTFAVRLKSYLRSRVALTAFLEAYLKIQKLVAADLSRDFNDLINKLNVTQKIGSFLYHRSFDDVILAIQTLSNLRRKQYERKIKQFAQSRNFTVRNEAYAALTRLFEKESTLVQYIGTKHDLSMLDINTIVNTALKNPQIAINCQALLTSDNLRKIAVGLILVQYRYNRNNFSFLIILKFIGHSNAEINKLAWEALLFLIPDNEFIEIVTSRFDSETEDIKILILEKSTHIRQKEYFDFIHRVVHRQSLLVKTAMLKLIFLNDFDALVNYLNSDDESIKMAYKEATCLYL